MGWSDGKELPAWSFDADVANNPDVADRGQVAGLALRWALWAKAWTICSWCFVTYVSLRIVRCDGELCEVPVLWLKSMNFMVVPPLICEWKALAVVLVPFVRSFSKNSKYPEILDYDVSFKLYFMLNALLSYVRHANLI